MADVHELIVTCIIFLYQIFLIFVSYDMCIMSRILIENVCSS